MSTPSTTPLLPPIPPVPVPMPIAIDCDPLMPVLCLPPPIGTTQNALFPTTSSTSSIPSTSNVLRPHPLNPELTTATDKKLLPMIVPFHTSQLTTEPSPTHHHILQESVFMIRIVLKTMLHRRNYLYRPLAYLWLNYMSCLLLTPHQVRPTSNMGLALLAISYGTPRSLSHSWHTKCAT